MNHRYHRFIHHECCNQRTTRPQPECLTALGLLEAPKEDGGVHACNATPNFDSNTAAGWAKSAMRFHNTMHFCVIYHGQQADGTSGAQTLLHGGRSYNLLDDILPPPAKSIINDIGEVLDDDGQTRCPHPRNFQTTKTGFQKFKRKLQIRIIRHQQLLQVMPSRECGLLEN